MTERETTLKIGGPIEEFSMGVCAACGTRWIGGHGSCTPRPPMQLSVRCSLVRPEAKVPTYATEGSVGLDMYSCDDVDLTFGNTFFFDTGVVFELPDGYEGQVRGRSSLAKRGVFTCGGFGTCDPDYRGAVGVSLAWVANRLQTGLPTGYNGKEATIQVKRGDKIAQVIVAPKPRIHLRQVPFDELNKTQRGAGGFGSTGR